MEWDATCKAIGNNIADLKEKFETTGRHLEQHWFNAMDRRQAKQLVIEKGMKHILCSNQGHYRLWWWRTHCQGNRGQSHLSWSLSWSCIAHKQQNKEERAINIANLRLLQKGKAPLKSVSTAFNRSGPRSLRALQAKRHIGKGLFCLKKPPKVEDCSNENTHYIPKGTCEQHKHVVLLT